MLKAERNLANRNRLQPKPTNGKPQSSLLVVYSRKNLTITIKRDCTSCMWREKKANGECVSGRYDKSTINLNRVIWQVGTIFTMNPKCLRENVSQFKGTQRFNGTISVYGNFILLSCRLMFIHRFCSQQRGENRKKKYSAHVSSYIRLRSE